MSSTDTPIIVKESPTFENFWSSVRVFLIAFGAYGAGKGWFDANLFAAAVPVFLIGVPFAVGQWNVWRQHQRLVVAADAAQSRVARVVR